MPWPFTFLFGWITTPRFLAGSFLALIGIAVTASYTLYLAREYIRLALSSTAIFLLVVLLCNFWGVSEIFTAVRGWQRGDAWDFNGAWFRRGANIIRLDEDLTKLSNEQCVKRSRQLNDALTACLTQLGEDGRAARQRALKQEMLVIQSMHEAATPSQIDAGAVMEWKYTGLRPQYHAGGFYW